MANIAAAISIPTTLATDRFRCRKRLSGMRGAGWRASITTKTTKRTRDAQRNPRGRAEFQPTSLPGTGGGPRALPACRVPLDDGVDGEQGRRGHGDRAADIELPLPGRRLHARAE